MSFLPQQPQHIPHTGRSSTPPPPPSDDRPSPVDHSHGMSVAVGAVIASASLVLSVVVLQITLFFDISMAFGMALIPGGLTFLSALGLAYYRRHRRRQGLTLRPRLIPLVVWSVVGVPVLAIGSHLIPFLLMAGSEYSQAGIAVVGIFLMLHGWWIAALISITLAMVIKHRERTAQA